MIGEQYLHDAITQAGFRNALLFALLLGAVAVAIGTAVAVIVLGDRR